MAARDQFDSFRSRSGLFTLAFAAALVLLALLGNFGLPDSALGTTLGVGVLVAFVIAGVSERTIQASEFLGGGTGLPAFVNGIASAAAFLSSVLVLGLVSAYFSDYATGIAITLGWCFGFLLLAVLIAPYFRRSGADSAADFLGIRYGSGTVRFLAAAVVVVTLAPALVAAVATGATVVGQLFGVPPRTATAVVVALVLSGTLLGGLRAVTLTAMVQYIVLAIAFVVPAAIVSTLTYSLPVPPIASGFAYQDAAALDVLSMSPVSTFLPFAPHSQFELFAAVISLAAGVATLPHLLMRHAAMESPRAARRSAAWSLAFVLIIALTAPAYATFARLAFLRDIVGSAIDELPDWFFGLGQKGLVTLCGSEPVSIAAAQAACSATGGTVIAGNLAVSGDAVVLSWGDIVGLPYVMTALIAVGLLAAAIAAANAMGFAIAQTIGNDIYGRLLDTKASAGRRLIVTRVVLVATILAAAWIGFGLGADVFRSALAGLSLSAGGLFPAMVLAIWWKRANWAGALAGIVTGFGVTAVILLGRHFQGLVPFDPSDLSELSAAIVGVPAGFAAALVGSLMSQPNEQQEAFVDALRAPGTATRRDATGA